MSTLAYSPRPWMVHVWVAVFGLLLGYCLSRIGFTDYTEVHKMFTLADLRLIFVFGGGVALTAIGMFAFRKREPLKAKLMHRGVFVGSVLFGVGWAITGACPGVVFAQIGEGKWMALISLAGMLIGTALYRPMHARFFRWDREIRE